MQSDGDGDDDPASQVRSNGTLEMYVKKKSATVS